jgi:hypothetical protein
MLDDTLTTDLHHMKNTILGVVDRSDGTRLTIIHRLTTEEVEVGIRCDIEQCLILERTETNVVRSEEAGGILIGDERDDLFHGDLGSGWVKRIGFVGHAFIITQILV